MSIPRDVYEYASNLNMRKVLTLWMSQCTPKFPLSILLKAFVNKYLSLLINLCVPLSNSKDTFFSSYNKL